MLKHSRYALAIVSLDAHNDPGRRVLDHLKAVQQTVSVYWIDRREDGGVSVGVSVIVRVIRLLWSNQGKGKCMVRPLGNYSSWGYRSTLTT